MKSGMEAIWDKKPNKTNVSQKKFGNLITISFIQGLN